MESINTLLTLKFHFREFVCPISQKEHFKVNKAREKITEDLKTPTHMYWVHSVYNHLHDTAAVRLVGCACHMTVHQPLLSSLYLHSGPHASEFLK